MVHCTIVVKAFLKRGRKIGPETFSHESDDVAVRKNLSENIFSGISFQIYLVVFSAFP